MATRRVRHGREVLPLRSIWLRGVVLGLAVVAGAAGCVGDAPTSSAGPAVASLPATAGGSPSPSPSPATMSREEGWTADLRRLVTDREAHHQDPWHGIERQAYVAAVEAVVARVPQLSDHAVMVEVVRLAAMPTWAGRDGHGGIHPWGEGTYPMHLYPLRLYAFTDGIFVVDALAPYAALIGERVVSIKGHDIDTVMAAVEPLVPRDNHQQVLSHGVRLMVAAEVLHGLGLIDDPGQPVTIRFEDAGDVQMTPVPMPEFERWAGGHHTHSPPIRPAGAPWISRLDEEIWWEWLPETRTAYVQYNVTVGGLNGIVAEIGAQVDAGDVQRLVLDVRHNPGGNNHAYYPILSLLRSADARGIPVYVVMSRATFSAAGNLVTEIERSTDAVLVGEDLGTSPNQYGDSIPITLAHSGLVFRVAPQYIVRGEPDDPRITIEPDLPAPLSSTDYFTDQDPAMAAILPSR